MPPIPVPTASFFLSLVSRYPLPPITTRHHKGIRSSPDHPQSQNPNLSPPPSLPPLSSLRFPWTCTTASGYGAYRLYYLPSVVEKRRKISKILEALASIAEAVSSSADTISLVSADLNRFLRSDSDEIPASLRQISKIARSDELVDSVSRVSEALTVGIVRGVGSGSSSGEVRAKSEFADRILDKLFSASGSGFASVVVGSFARNLVIGFYSSGSQRDSDSGSIPSWIQLVCGDEKCRALIANCVQLFVSSAVAVFLEKTMDVNTYDELFAGITNPKHEVKVKELLVTVCNGAVETLIKTSHQVLMKPSLNCSVNRVESKQKGVDSAMEIDNRGSFDVKEQSSGWFDQVSSTLAIPSNRRFVLDVTGRVTFETVRSFLDFVLWKLYDGAKRGVHAVHEGVVERGFEVVRYISAKSMLIVTICLALCMRVMAGTRVLMPV
ncbi:protein PHLOEM PROTEIN 2-LIKE A10-like [Asparagus officinalis]|nr:protein PHLOEM PROTEIN 2-LIKE A10-like [Asparagus officinalis]